MEYGKHIQQHSQHQDQKNETIVLNYLDANTVAGEFIYVYVTGSDGVTEPWRYDKDELFINMSRENVTEINFASIYNNKEPVYSVRVNEDKNYEIKFGNNVIGKKLSNGDLIHILYLETNGEDGYIDMSDIQTAELIDGTLQFPSQIKNLLTDESSKIVTNVKLHLIENSTKPTPIETVDEIRQNAPYYFKYGNRLITKEDYEYFIRTNYINEVVDVKCQNNFDYISTFFQMVMEHRKEWKVNHTRKKEGIITLSKIDCSEIIIMPIHRIQTTYTYGSSSYQEFIIQVSISRKCNKV